MDRITVPCGIDKGLIVLIGKVGRVDISAFKPALGVPVPS